MKTRILSTIHYSLFTASAQQEHLWETYLNEVMTIEDVGTAAWEEMYELLCELDQHPMDLNHVSREQLEQLPFLSAQQVEGIMEYLWRYGRMESLGELAMIRELDYSQRRLLTYFIYIDEKDDDNRQKPPSIKNVAKYGHHELMATGRVPFYERKGDKEGYLGPGLWGLRMLASLSWPTRTAGAMTTTRCTCSCATWDDWSRWSWATTACRWVWGW